MDVATAPVCGEVLVFRVPPRRSFTDAALHAKLREYQENGARLGWLLDPEMRSVWIYREGAAEPDEVRDPSTIAGDPVLPGFVLDVKAVWRAAGD